MLKGVSLAAYLAASILAVWALYRPQCGIWARWILAGGWVAQSWWLVRLGEQVDGLPVLTLPAWLAVLAWLVAGFALLTMAYGRRYRSMGGFLLPVAFVLWSIDLGLLSRARPTMSNLHGWLLVHIGSATAAVVVFLLAAVVGLMYTEKERELRHKSVEVFYYRLPALQEMDRLSALLAAIGLLLWLLAIGAGWMVVSSSRSTTVSLFNVTALWALITAGAYATYLAMRQFGGWRGRRAAVLLMTLFMVVAVNFMTIGRL